MRLVDVNLWCDAPQGAAAAPDSARTWTDCERWGINEGWIASFRALFDADPLPVSLQVRRAVGDSPGIDLRWFATVNPRCGAIARAVRETREAGFAGIRIYPPAHGYNLASTEFRELLERAWEAGLVVQLVVRIEDQRTQVPPGKWPDVDVDSLATLQLSGPLVLLNCYWRQLPPLLLANDKVFLDTAVQEGLGPLDQAVAALGGPDRILLGTYSPVFTMAAGVLKLFETELSEDELGKIARSNARRLIHGGMKDLPPAR